MEYISTIKVFHSSYGLPYKYILSQLNLSLTCRNKHTPATKISGPPSFQNLSKNKLLYKIVYFSQLSNFIFA